MAVKLKRVYDKAERADGVRVLVDRLWPRGLKKDDAALDEWIRQIAPSNELRSWFAHKPERWLEFQKRYRKELQQPGKRTILRSLRKISRITTLTLLYASADTEHNQAVVLAGLLKAGRR